MFLLFAPGGACGKVWSSEDGSEDSAFALSGVPDAFSSFKREPAFGLDRITFCFWQIEEQAVWHSMPGNRPAYPWLKFLTGDIRHYHDWSQEYYGRGIRFDAVRRVYYDHEITDEVLTILNPDVSRCAMKPELSAILYSKD